MKFCIDCSKKLSNYYAKRCKSCSSKGLLNYQYGRKGKNSPAWKNGGKKYYCPNCSNPISRKAKCCKSCTQLGNKNSFYDKQHTNKTRKLMSQNHTDFSGRKNPMFGKQTHGIKSKYKNIWMRSSYEIAFAQFLDGSGIKWFYEFYSFEVNVKSKETTYTPDFYLPQFDCWIEIKGYWRKDAKEKFEAFKKQFYDINIKVFNKDKLERMGIL